MQEKEDQDPKEVRELNRLRKESISPKWWKLLWQILEGIKIIMDNIFDNSENKKQ